MTSLRVVMLGVVFVFCTGFIPVSGCAKGCGRMGGTAARSGDDFARVGTRYGDDFAGGASRYGKYGTYGDDLAGAGRYRPPIVVGSVGHTGDDLAHLTRNSLDDSLAALPEAEGSISTMARKPTSSGTTVDGLDDAGRNFGKDYAKSVDDLGISKKQHDELMDAFETAQDITKDAVEALAEEDDEVDVERIAAAAKARERLQLVALELEAQVSTVLTPSQFQKFQAQFGSSELVAYRLGKDQPVKRKKRAKATVPKSSGKVEP